MNLKSKLLLALLATSSAAFADTAPESTLGYNVGVVSEYRYRGMGQSRGEAALQGGVDYAHSNGFYAGAWGSTIKWIKDTDPTYTGSVELDMYGGYKFEAAGLGYDVGYLRYEYVNNNMPTNANTDEAYAAVTAGPATLKYSYAFSDLFGNADSKGSTYWDLSANFDLGNGYTITPHAGRQFVKNSTLSYTDVALTVGKDLGNGLAATVSAISTSGKAGTFTNTLNNYNSAKSIVVVGVKYSF